MPHNSNRIPADTLKKLRLKLEALPPKPKVDYSRQETVKELETLIRHAVGNLGYSITDIAGFYSEQAWTISPSTISGFLRDLAPKQIIKKPRKVLRGSQPRTPVPVAPVEDLSHSTEAQEFSPQDMVAEFPDEDAERDEHLIRAHYPPEIR